MTPRTAFMRPRGETAGEAEKMARTTGRATAGEAARHRRPRGVGDVTAALTRTALLAALLALAPSPARALLEPPAPDPLGGAGGPRPHSPLGGSRPMRPFPRSPRLSLDAAGTAVVLTWTEGPARAGAASEGTGTARAGGDAGGLAASDAGPPQPRPPTRPCVEYASLKGEGPGTWMPSGLACGSYTLFTEPNDPSVASYVARVTLRGLTPGKPFRYRPARGENSGGAGGREEAAAPPRLEDGDRTTGPCPAPAPGAAASYLHAMGPPAPGSRVRLILYGDMGLHNSPGSNDVRDVVAQGLDAALGPAGFPEPRPGEPPGSAAAPPPSQADLFVRGTEGVGRGGAGPATGRFGRAVATGVPGAVPGVDPPEPSPPPPFVDPFPTSAVVHLGDLAYDLADERGGRGRRFLAKISPIASRAPYLVLPGNHDVRPAAFAHICALFSFPGGGEAEMKAEAGGEGGDTRDRPGGRGGGRSEGDAGETRSPSGAPVAAPVPGAWRVSLGGLPGGGPMVDMVALNTEALFWPEAVSAARAAAQGEWLDRALADARGGGGGCGAGRRSSPRRPGWLLSLGHRPMFDPLAGKEEARAVRLGIPSECPNDNPYACREAASGAGAPRTPLEPILTSRGVDLAVWGHVHSYMRTWPMANKTRLESSGRRGAPTAGRGAGGARAAPSLDRLVDPAGPIHVTSGAGGNQEMRKGEPGAAPVPPGPCPPRSPSWCAWQSGRFSRAAHPDAPADQSFSVVDAFNETHLRWVQISTTARAIVDVWWIVRTQREGERAGDIADADADADAPVPLRPLASTRRPDRRPTLAVRTD